MVSAVQRSAKGYGSAYSLIGAVHYAAIFVKTPGPAFSAYHGRTEA